MTLSIRRENGDQRRLEPSDSGVVNTGFCELRESLFVKPDGDWSLYIDDVPAVAETEQGLQLWKWKPGFYAGTVRADLVRGQDATVTSYLLDVSPDPNKLGQDAFNQMVRDIWRFDPALVLGEEAATTAIGVSGNRDNPEVRYARMAAYGDSLIRALRDVRIDPHKGIRQSRQALPFHQVRRADRQTLQIATRSAAALALLEENLAIEIGIPPRFDVPLSEPTFDTAANRTLGALLLDVKRAVDALVDYFQERVSRADADEDREIIARWPRRRLLLEQLCSQVSAALALAPFRFITRFEITAAGLTAVAAKPTYARAQQLIWKMLRIGYETERPVEFSAMSPTWAIYESWCFACLAEGLQARYQSWKWRRLDRSEQRRYALVGTSGATTIELHYQKSFAYSPPSSEAGTWSISAHFIPDIVIVVRSNEVNRLIVLDAKYRSGRQNILEAMRSAHVYRDALRLGSRAPDLSILLIPAPCPDAAWLGKGEFHQTHGVGTVVLSPTAPSLDAALQCVTATLATA